jgi:hypothetical protein
MSIGATHQNEDKPRIPELTARVAGDPDYTPVEKARMLRGLIPPVIQTDRWIYRMVVGFLGATVLMTVAGGFCLAILSVYRSHDSNPSFNLPDGLIALGSAAVGALAGLLAPQPNERVEPQINLPDEHTP